MLYTLLYPASNSLGCKARFWLFKPSSKWFKGAKHKLIWNQDLFGCHKTSNWDFPRLFQLAWSKEKVVCEMSLLLHTIFSLLQASSKRCGQYPSDILRGSPGKYRKTSLFKIFKSGIRIQCTCDTYDSNVVFFRSRLWLQDITSSSSCTLKLVFSKDRVSEPFQQVSTSCRQTICALHHIR